MSGDAGAGYTRVEAVLQKWEGHRSPDDGPPDDVITNVHYIDPDGNEVTDEAVVAVLNARYERREQG